MLRAFATVVLAITPLIQSTACGQIKDFPYEATVVADEAFVRSGPGDAYYPTQKILQDSTVTVHRHDPGGWYMIDPPQGSFSWIPERFVRRVSEQEGEVTDDTFAFVGSEFGDEVSVLQRRMKVGEKVMIIGQRQIDTTNGIQSMIQIEPPARERRWIPGSAIIPADPVKRQQANSDPYAVPGNAKRPDGAILSPSQVLTSKTASGSGVSDVPVIAPSAQLTRLQLIRSEQQRLAEIDSRFRDMILQDVSNWNLDVIEGDYRALQESATHEPVSGQIDMRYPAIERYRRRLVQLQDLKQITSQTEMRDSALLARHQSATSQSGPQSLAIASPGPESIRIAGRPPQLSEEFASFVDTAASPVASMGDIAQLETSDLGASPSTAGAITPSSPQNRYIGAGIVQRNAGGEGSAEYVLITPSGRILAELKPTGDVRLEEFVGQKVGVQGSRWSEKDKRDIIEVSSLESVRIRQ